MVNKDFSIYFGDPVLTTLKELSIEKLQAELGESIPVEMLDAPLASYDVSNIRYTPEKKLIVGLTSDVGVKPISLRIFPRELLQNRLEKARRTHPDSTFLIDQLSAVAWVFPGERKLNLDPLADQEKLSAMLHEHRGYQLIRLELIHFVPEHTYTARLHGRRDDNSLVCEYLKIYYNNDGAKTASIVQQLAGQLVDSNIRIPGDVTYFSDQRMLLQPALPRDDSKTLADADAARALACFHGLSARVSRTSLESTDSYFAATLTLVAKTIPSCFEDVQRACAAIREALRKVPPVEDVLLHGDAHLGNLFPVLNGKVGMIDFDQVRFGPPEDDLASYFAFKLWLMLRDGRGTDRLLRQFPDFLHAYNVAAKVPVSNRRAYLILAKKMVTERIRRGIARGKIADESELRAFLDLSVACLTAASRYSD